MNNRLIIVTGASRGVGRATARSLVIDHGCGVLAMARDGAALAALKNECGASLETLPVDLASDDGIAQVVAALGGRRLHGLVNNAGVLVKRAIGEWTAADVSTVLYTNYTVPLLLCQALQHALDGDPPGHVVNIGSMGGVQGSVKFPGLLAYSASKAALANLSECLAEEWKDRSIRSNCIALGSVDTEMLRAAFPDYTAATSAEQAGAFIARFVLEGHALFNGKILPLATQTP